MESYKLPKFNFNFDGNMTLAKYIVNMYKMSKNFTLEDYPGKKDFLINSLTTYDEYTSILYSIASEYDVDVSDNTRQIFDNIREALERMPILKYEYLLRAYSEILKYVDKIKGIDILYGDYFARERITIENTIEEIQEIMISFSVKYKNLVPFTSKTGIFGYNTYLYLFFNDIYPVAVSANPYSVHNGLFPGSIGTMSHDFTHCDRIKCRGYPEKYINSLKYIYITMFTQGLEQGILEGYIIFLYEYLHEREFIIRCKPGVKVNSGTQDWSIQKVMLKNSFFTPERYGLNSEHISSFINHNIYGPDRDYLGQTAIYGGEIFDDIYKLFCSDFGHLLDY